MPTERIIAGTLYARHSAPTGYITRVHELGHGHVEATVTPEYAWSEIAALEGHALRDWEGSDPDFFGRRKDPIPPTQKQLLDRAAMNRERSARRARTKVRRLCKFKQLNTMLTLTYQENMEDRDRMQRDLDVFIKRVRRVLPGFQYLAVFEKQKRGAYHAHLAVETILSHYIVRGQLVKSYDLLRSLWRSVIGAGGAVNVARGRTRSVSKLASYLSKYIGKAFSDPALCAGKFQNAYSSSGRDLPAAVKFRTPGGSWEHSVCAHNDLFRMLDADLSMRGEFHTCFLKEGGLMVFIGPAPPLH